MAPELGQRREDLGRARVAELLLGEAAGDHRHRLEPRLAGCLDVPGRVADHDRILRPELVERSAHEVRLGLRRLDVVVRRPALDELTRVEQVEVVVELFLGRRAGEERRPAALLQVDDQVPGARERRDLADQPRVLGAARFADRLLVDVLARQGRDQLVAAHADVAVDAPDREHDSVLPEGAIPGDRVVVVRVDERAVDVQQDGPRHDYFGVASAWIAFCADASCRPSANSSMIFALNAGRSSGLRLETRPWSTTTSSSTHSAPAFRRSVCKLGQEVIFRPLTTPASISVHGPWQMTPIGFPLCANCWMNATTFSSTRS